MATNLLEMMELRRRAHHGGALSLARNRTRGPDFLTAHDHRIQMDTWILMTQQ
jgi:hypothetical protein